MGGEAGQMNSDLLWTEPGKAHISRTGKSLVVHLPDSTTTVYLPIDPGWLDIPEHSDVVLSVRLVKVARLQEDQ